MPKTSAQIEVFVSPAEFLELVLDVESYPEFLDEVQEVTVVSRDDTSLTASFEVSVSFGGYDVKTEYTVKYDTSQDDRVSWTLVSSPDLTTNAGSWRVEEGEDEDECIAHYEAELVSNLPIPLPVQEMFAKETLPQLLEAFRERAEG